MRIGIGIALPGRHGSSSLGPIAVIDFTTATPGAMPNAAFLSTYGLGFSRASAGTVQMTASTVDSTPGVDVARIGGTGAAWGVGLVFEETRTNIIPDARAINAASFTAGGAPLTTTANNFAGPDGTATVADESNVGAGGFSNFFQAGTRTGALAASSWQRMASGSGTANFVNAAAVNVTGAAATAPLTTAWKRLSATFTYSSVAAYIITCDSRDNSAIGGGTAAARDVVTDLLQLEAAQFPTEAIVTSGGTAARAAERLFKSGASAWLSSGTLNLEFKLAPKGSSTQYASNMRIWTDASDATSYVEISATTRLLTISVRGVVSTGSVAMSWAAQDVLEIFVAAGNGSIPSAWYRVNGGAAISIGSITASVPAIRLAGALDILNGAAANQLSSWLQSIKVWVSTASPSWIPAAAAPVFAANFTAFGAGDVGSAPLGFAFKRASVASTAATAAAITLGVPVDHAVVDLASDYGLRGLRIEGPCTNLLVNSRDMGVAATWTGAPVNVNDPSNTPANRNYAIGPDGLVRANRVQNTSTAGTANTSATATIATTVAAKYIASQYVRGTPTSGKTAPAPERYSMRLNSAGYPAPLPFGMASTSWRRVQSGALSAGATSATFAPLDDAGQNIGGSGLAMPQLGDTLVDCMQVEAGSICTSYVDSGSVSGTRAAVLLQRPNIADFLSSGRISARIVLEPLGASTDYGAGALQLLYYDANNQITVNASTLIATVTISGVAVAMTSAIPAWAIGDQLIIWIEAGGGSLATTMSASVNHGTEIVLGTGVVQAVWPASGAVDVLCKRGVASDGSDASNHFVSRLQTLNTYASGSAF